MGAADERAEATGSSTPAYREQVREEISDLLAQHPGQWSGLGMSSSPVRVELRASGEDLARRLPERYGDVVALTVGAHPYPPPDPLPLPLPDRLWPREPQRWEPPPPGLGLRTVVAAAHVRSGFDLEAVLVVTNTGSRPRELSTGRPLLGVLRRPGDPRVAGRFVGWVDGTGWDGTLEPGEAAEIDALAGTATADLADGYALPRGTYELVVPLGLYTWQGGGRAGPVTRTWYAGPAVSVEVI